MARKRRKYALRRTALKVLEIVENHLRTNATEIGAILEPETTNMKTISGKYLHHLKRLKGLGLIETKDLGGTLVAWPEKVATIKEKIEKLKKIRRDIDSLITA